MMDKKAQGMSLNVIVVAVLVLIILIVLILVFTGKIKLFGSKTTETTAQFSGNNCKVPGTNNECLDEETCRTRGGSWSAAPDGVSEYDCWEGCCNL